MTVSLGVLLLLVRGVHRGVHVMVPETVVEVSVVSCVVDSVNCDEGDGAGADVDAATLHSEKEMSIQRGDGLQTEAVQEAQATYSLRTHESRAGNVREGSSIGR